MYDIIQMPKKFYLFFNRKPFFYKNLSTQRIGLIKV